MPEPAPLLPVEERLLTPFNQAGLETFRKTMLASVSAATTLELRVRATLLTAHQNDFRAVFADVLTVPASILAESIIKPKKLFDVHASVSLLREVGSQALRELRGLGLSKGYADLIDERLQSSSPQYVVTAAAAVCLLGGMLAGAYVVPPAA